MSIKNTISDHHTLAYSFPSVTAFAAGDLLWNNAGAAARASAQADQLTEGANQALFASLFLGVSADARLVTETGAADRLILTDGIFDCTCPSTTWAVGDLVGPSEASNGTELENQQVEKVTVATRAIGYCVKAATSATTVRCRLISFYTPNVVYRGNLDATLADDVPLILGTGSDVNLLWSTADASNHAAVLALGASQALHVTDIGAEATDWNIAATTHPNVYIHSDTTPATDYLRLGGHDGTTAHVDVVGGTTLSLDIDGTAAATLTASALTGGATCKGVFAAGIRTKQAVNNVHDTAPTIAELTTSFGDPATLGRGFIGTVDDNDGDAINYLVWVSDASYYFLKGTKAA